VPTFHRESGLKLGWWVATLRRNKKEISTERLTRLDKIGFVWNAPRGAPRLSSNKAVPPHRPQSARKIKKRPPKLLVA
jgi:Helicase associated domain